MPSRGETRPGPPGPCLTPPPPPGQPGRRLLVVNADDYGLTEGISRGILRAHHDGIVTSTSVSAVGPALPVSGPWLADAPALGVGLHLAAVGEDPPLLSAPEIPSLVDAKGRLPRTWRSFVGRALSGRIDPDDLAREFSAQLELVAQLGVAITHLDTDQHLHLWPMVGQVVVELAGRRGITALRVPRSTGGRMVGVGVNHLAAGLARRAAAAGLTFTEASAGFDEAGGLDAAALDRVLAKLAATSATTLELVAHPGEPDDPARCRYKWGYRWVDELAALSGPPARAALARHGFVGATHAALVAAG